MLQSFDGLSDRVEQINPDWVLYIGAIPRHHRLPVPSIDVLKSIRRPSARVKYPLVHLCCDGADDAWWSLLGEYHTVDCFDLQINIDGVKAGPIGEFGMTTIAPIDPEPFGNPPPWSSRQISVGFPGLRMGGDRQDTLNALIDRGLVTHRWRDGSTYQEYIDWLHNCRVIWNHPETGGMKSQHVKARVIEAALAGCLVLEKEGSPLNQWLHAGTDYITWEDADDVTEELAMMKEFMDEAEEMAKRTREKLLTEYSVDKFWLQVEERIGVGFKSVILPPPTAEQEEYLRGIARYPDFDPNTIVGGPR
jgi:hypothetical protein